MNILIVSRYPALTEHILELGLAYDHTDVLTHVDSPEQVRDRDVIGILPMHLAAAARSVTEIPIRHTLESQAQAAKGDLTLEQVRELAGEPVTYQVTVQRFSGPAPDLQYRNQVDRYMALVREYCRPSFEATGRGFGPSQIHQGNAYDAVAEVFRRATGLAYPEPYPKGASPFNEWAADLAELTRRLVLCPLPPGGKIERAEIINSRAVAVLHIEGIPRVSAAIPLSLTGLCARPERGLL